MSESSKKSLSLPPLSKKHLSYIQRTFELLQSGCQSDRLRIDGQYGDYRMRLFRLKDRKAYANKINSVFTSSFTQSIMPPNSHNEELRKKINQIIGSKKHKQELMEQKQHQKLVAEQVVYRKGDLSKVMEEQEYLFSYLPERQSKWFQVKNASARFQAPVLKLDSPALVHKAKPYVKKPHKSKYIFAYLDNPASFNTIK